MVVAQVARGGVGKAVETQAARGELARAVEAQVARGGGVASWVDVAGTAAD